MAFIPFRVLQRSWILITRRYGAGSHPIGTADWEKSLKKPIPGQSNALGQSIFIPLLNFIC